MINIRSVDKIPFPHFKTRIDEILVKIKEGNTYLEVSGISAENMVKFRAVLYKKFRAENIDASTRVKGSILYVIVA